MLTPRRGRLRPPVPLALVPVLLALLVPAAATAKPGSTTTGYDISYPQCGGSYPAGAAFGIVGVDGGLANDSTPNSCFSGEVSWALATPGLSNPLQPNASLYINTADPGPGVSDWPTSGTTTPYGTCDPGAWSTACAYIYGENMATISYDVAYNDSPAVATGAPWWLDIETANSWATSTTPNYTALNIAAIHGFIDGLKADGATAPAGVYSTASQWSAITGLDAGTTPAQFAGLSDWIAGARTSRQAQSNCTSGGFTGVAPALAQYHSGGFDADLRCG